MYRFVALSSGCECLVMSAANVVSVSETAAPRRTKHAACHGAAALLKIELCCGVEYATLVKSNLPAVVWVNKDADLTFEISRPRPAAFGGDDPFISWVYGKLGCHSTHHMTILHV